ncbi:MAG: SIR2 family protein, partial [bacterium]|nr:SIR2 family protein [bacterium]
MMNNNGHSKKGNCTEYWTRMEEFNILCEIVMQNRLVCLTGAGISKNLELQDGTTAPDWKELLDKLAKKLNDKLDKEQKKDIKNLLAKNATGEQMIEAATILKRADKKLFDQSFVNAVKLKEGIFSPTHKCLLELCPNGIITYNYDEAHENALKASAKNDWIVLTPYEEDKIVEIVLNRFNQKFLLKAHGTVSKKDNMVLTRDS